MEQVVEYIDRVFTGEQNPTLPVVSYDIVSVNGEAINDGVADQDGN